MVSIETSYCPRPVVVMLHWLGGSARSWTEVAAYLEQMGFRTVPLDLPGFGDCREDRNFTLDAMVRSAIQAIRTHREDESEIPWFLVGHSMGGKIAAMIARAAEDGEHGLSHLEGIVLISPSPPGIEPMKESKRRELFQRLGFDTTDSEERSKYAETFLDDNIGKLPLQEIVRRRSVEDVLRMNPGALEEWLSNGSKTDCSAFVGSIRTPALILAGTEEDALGTEAQKVGTLPHFEHATVVPLVGAGHLAPLERPSEVSDRMVEFFTESGVLKLSTGAKLSTVFSELIDSDRTSPQTRDALLNRIETDGHEASLLSKEELRTLRALSVRVVPSDSFNLAARVHQSLAENRHDGWRFNTLPDDQSAWKQGLASLDFAAEREFGVPFIALDHARQDHLLKRAQQGDLSKGLLGKLNFGESSNIFDAEEMRDWFEDVRGEFAKAYVADPRTMERIGFAGFADEKGFTQIRLEQRSEVKS